MRAIQQFATAVDGLTRQNVDLQTELAQSRLRAGCELAALMQELPAPERGSQTTGVGVDARLLGKPGDFSSAQDAWRDWSAVFQGYAGAAVPRMPIPNATILVEDDRAASAQLCWMMLKICWRQLTENTSRR